MTLRRWKKGDEAALVKHANSYHVWRNVRDTFPHPYTWADAEAWLKLTDSETVPTVFAIDCDGEAVGGIGVVLGKDIHRVNAEIGYWLGESYWGRGIVSQLVPEMVAYTFDTFSEIHRIYAGIFEFNQASMRVLEKAGFEKEAILKKSIVKENQLWDEHIYALLRK
jgi:[ribosomal protein S5]-alanine N-acetyltransferase